MNLGTIGWIRRKVASEFSNFKRLKNPEDSSDFDDSWMKSIAPYCTCFSKIFATSKFSRRRTKIVKPIRTEISARPIRDRGPDRTGPDFVTDPTDRTNIVNLCRRILLYKLLGIAINSRTWRMSLCHVCREGGHEMGAECPDLRSQIKVDVASND